MSDGLHEKNKLIGEVVTFKLNSGQELIGKFLSETETHYVVAYPFVLVQLPPQNAGEMPGLGFQPALITADINEVQLEKTSIQMKAKSNENTAAEHQKNTSPILTPNNKLIVK
jgi:hypothetical protein